MLKKVEIVWGASKNEDEDIDIKKVADYKKHSPKNMVAEINEELKVLQIKLNEAFNDRNFKIIDDIIEYAKILNEDLIRYENILNNK